MKATPATFNGIDLVWMKKDDGEGALAYPDHVDENGDIRDEHVLSDSYAHVCSGGRVMRYREQVGSVGDLKPR